ncbi:MAG TPA: alpha/beta hydrolase [Acidimicrobiales bacterium]|jgi:pimeloyl-ACP methyl ester carboxylesterase
MPYLDVNGLRFHYQRVGAGDAADATVVMLHGMLVDNLSSLYYTTAPAVADFADVLLYDLRGHGRTERPPSGYGLDQGVDDLLAMLDLQGISRPVYLLGNSYGGTIGLATAQRYPERVAGLILIEAHFSVEGWSEEFAKDLELAGFGLDAEDMQRWLDAHAGRKINKLADQALSLVGQTSMIADLRGAPTLHADALRAIDCPTIAIYGEYSDVIDRAHDLEALHPCCEMNIMLDCSHSALMEATITVRSLVRDWLIRRAAGEESTSRTTKVRVREGEGSGEEHRSTVEMYKAELRRRHALVAEAKAAGIRAVEARAVDADGGAG